MNIIEDYANQQHFPLDEQMPLLVNDTGLFLNLSDEGVFLTQGRDTDSNSVYQCTHAELKHNEPKQHPITLFR
jgi:hypothetical protein